MLICHPDHGKNETKISLYTGDATILLLSKEALQMPLLVLKNFKLCDVVKLGLRETPTLLFVRIRIKQNNFPF